MMDAPLSPAAQVAADNDKASMGRNRWLTMPAIIIIILFGILPLFIVVLYSFLTPAPYGGVATPWTFTTDAYVHFFFDRDIIDDSVLVFDPVYLWIYFRTIMYALATTIICLLFGFPTAYFMATRPPEQRNWWVLLITIPFWSNLLVRTLSIMLIIRDQGLINNFLIWAHIIDKPLVMIYTDFAIMLGLLYSYLPFMVLPLYSSLEKMDFRLVEAGYDLYATQRKVLWRVIIPLAMPGIIAGCLLVFIPALGSYVTPLILGGGTHSMIGDLIANQFGSGRAWPFGSAQALILMVVVLIALYYYVRNTTGGIKHG